MASNYAKSLTVETGDIHVVFGDRANGALRGMTLSVRPAVVDDAAIEPVAWVRGFGQCPSGWP